MIHDRESLLEHVETLGYPAADPIARLSELPVIVDETVEPGWLELRNGNEVVDRVRLA